VGFAVVAALFAAVATSVLVASGADPRARACGADGARVRAAFALSQASDFWTHFPNALEAPELRVDTPAFVVVFDEPVRLAITGNPHGRSTGTIERVAFDHVVCVLIGESPNFYFNVDTTGFKP